MKSSSTLTDVAYPVRRLDVNVAAVQHTDVFEGRPFQ
jgi:hypothetical protein